METDVAVIGGGLAGMVAAWTAARSGAKVVLVDKARAGTSGPTAFAAGDILCWLPSEDSLQEWVDAYLEAGQGLNSAAWLARLFEGNYRCVERLVSEGFPLETGPEGKWTRRSGRGPMVRCVLAPVLQWQERARRRCLELEVTILDRVAAQRVLVVNGKAAGVAGFDVRSGEFHAVAAPAVVLASGGCSYRGPFFGQHAVAGEGLKMALEAGATLAYMEYGNHYNVSLRRFATYGQSKFMAHGGRYVNRLGEPFLARTNPGLGHRASGNEAVSRMVEEVRAGRGPVYLDVSRFEEWDLAARLMPNLVRALERGNVDLRAEPQEVIPAFTGTSNAAAAGVFVDKQCQSTLPGLFAAGDVAGKGLAIGACIGMTGVSLAWANYTGHLAGSSAADRAAQAGREAIPSDLLKETKAQLLAPLGLDRRESPRALLAELSELMGRVDVSLIRHEGRLRGAIAQVGRFRARLAETGACDSHDLMLWHEASSSLVSAEATLLSALERRESRGGHLREDYPETDPTQDSVLLLRRGDHGPELRRARLD